MTTTMRMVVQFVLCFSLVVAFTTSAAAALCLQMEHRGPAMMAGSTMAMDSPGPVTSAGEVTGAAEMDGALGPKGSLSASACCHQQVSTPQAVTASQRALPAEQTASLPVRVERFFADTGCPPPGLFDPALEKRDHLTPSMTVLSISRT